MAKIKSVTVITNELFSQTSVGLNGVAEIKDETKEWEDGIDFIYSVYDKEGKLLEQIINCPVQIEYAREAEEGR